MRTILIGLALGILMFLFLVLVVAVVARPSTLEPQDESAFEVRIPTIASL